MCEDFSLERYKQRYGLHTLRLFLLRDSTVSSKESDYEELKKSSFEDSGSEEPEEMQSR